jgi:hypothetical protein
VIAHDLQGTGARACSVSIRCIRQPVQVKRAGQQHSHAGCRQRCHRNQEEERNRPGGQRDRTASRGTDQREKDSAATDVAGRHFAPAHRHDG